jgi:DNA replication and repair protein RecF
VQVTRLEVQDVRSYASASLDLEPGVTVLLGPNAQGKTNLLEALVRAATGSSHRVAGDTPLVRAGQEVGVIRVGVRTDEGRRRTLELEVGSGRRTRTRVDGQDVRRAAEALGVVRAVLFAPEDLAIVRGEPDQRRRFLDDLLSQRRPAYVSAKAEYDRVLKQRNQLLKQARGLSGASRDAALATLDTWTEQLIAHGAGLLAARIAVVHALAGPVDRTYRGIADRPEAVGLTYRSSTGRRVVGDPAHGVPDRDALAAELRAAQEDRARDEQQRGVTLVGPHRDDLVLDIGGLSSRTHASQGEAWSLALSLRLATYEVLADVGDQPVVLLDDVFSELDERRRSQLAEACRTWPQVLVTAAVQADVPLQGRWVDVRIDDGRSTLSPRPRAVDPPRDVGGAA